MILSLVFAQVSFRKANVNRITQAQIVLFSLFYGDQIDKYDFKHIGKYLKLTDNDLTITNSGSYAHGSAFGTIICDKGLYQWKFEINKITSGFIFIVICRIEEDPSPATDIRFAYGNQQGYGYYLKGEKFDIITVGSTNNVINKYGNKCVTGNIVHRILDLYGITLSFKVNDVDYGAAYDNIKESKYRAAALFLLIIGLKSLI